MRGMLLPDVRCLAFLQRHWACNFGDRVFRWADAFKNSAASLLFLGQTQPGILVMKRTLQAVMVSNFFPSLKPDFGACFRVLLSQLVPLPSSRFQPQQVPWGLFHGR